MDYEWLKLIAEAKDLGITKTEVKSFLNRKGKINQMGLQVVDKASGKIVWTETHDTKESLSQAIDQLKQNTFNPDYFLFINEDK